MKEHTYELEKSLLIVADVLSVSDKNDDKVEILLPESLLNIKEDEVIKEKIKWKEAVYKAITNSNKFLSGQMIFERLKINYPIELHNRRSSMKNISSAISNLVQEGKVGKFKNHVGLYFFGHSIKHFEKNGKPNMNLYEKSN